MDLDALLWRKPQLAIVDELAHTNVEGSRHVKRHQDVEELLAAGIDVFTTLNVQHIESLNDIVERISRVRVRETLPDKVLELADEIELVDLPPDDLIQRLREGKVYVRDQIGSRDSALLRQGQPHGAARARDARRRRARRRGDGRLHARARHRRALADPGPAPGLRQRVRRWPRSWSAPRSAWRSARACRGSRSTCIPPRHDSLSDDAKDRIAEALRLAETLGGEAVTLHAESDVVKELLAFARSRNVTRILLGRPRRRRWSGWLSEHVTGSAAQ